jgi:hypothetical protein
MQPADRRPVVEVAEVGGLHHHYERVAARGVLAQHGPETAQPTRSARAFGRGRLLRICVETYR